MKHITFYLDFVSPYAWLAYERLPDALEGLSYSVSYKPVLLGALLQQHANPGPAGIAPKRDWTYRHVTWLGHAQGTPLQMPARHPFNPLPLLRQALACSDDGCINRFVAGALLRHVWQGGNDALDAERLRVLAEQPVLSACLLLWWTTSCSGGSMACPCCARIWRETPGSTARSGMRWRWCHQGWHQPPRVDLLLI